LLNISKTPTLNAQHKSEVDLAPSMLNTHPLYRKDNHTRKPVLFLIGVSAAHALLFMTLSVRDAARARRHEAQNQMQMQNMTETHYVA